MDVNIQRGGFHCGQNTQIGIVIIFGMDAPLQADFRRAASDSFGSAPAHFLKIKRVSRAAQIPSAAFGKGAEATFIEADIGVVDVATTRAASRRYSSVVAYPIA